MCVRACGRDVDVLPLKVRFTWHSRKLDTEGNVCILSIGAPGSALWHAVRVLRWVLCLVSPVAAQKGKTSPDQLPELQNKRCPSVRTHCHTSRNQRMLEWCWQWWSLSQTLWLSEEPPHVGSVFCSSNQDTFYQLCLENPYIDTETLRQTGRHFSICTSCSFYLSYTLWHFYGTFHALSVSAS